MKNLRWVILVFVVLACISQALSQTNIPKLDQRVNDFTNTLSFQEWQSIDRLLKSYEDTASVQVVVLMVNSLDGIGIEDYANKVFEENKIGQAHQESGALLVILKPDQKVYVKTGSGIEGVLTNTVLSNIISTKIQPLLKVNNYFGGIVTGVDAMIRAKKGEYQVDNLTSSWDLGRIIKYVIIVLACVLILYVLNKMIKRKKQTDQR